MIRTIAASSVYPRSAWIAPAVRVFSSGCSVRQRKQDREKARTHRLLRLDGRDVHARARVRKVRVVREHVVVAHILALRPLREHALLAQREALQRPPKLAVLCARISERLECDVGKWHGPMRVAALISLNVSSSASLNWRRTAAW
jgi:hypothetical protein